MPSKRNLNMLRMFEIQMKNGYLKEVPWEYEIARKYPPLSHDPNDRFDNKPLGKVGYLKYYNAALDRNPVMFGEGVHHAYWRQKPLAMILAQKQYELIQQGMDEEKAYQQAITYVDEFESKAYDNLKNVLNSIKFDMHGRDTLISDPETAVAIEECRRKLEVTPYPELPLEDQGEIDYIIQTKILKWLEVERERRMRDPVFYQQFETLRLSIFPEIRTNVSMKKLKGEKWQLRNLYFSSIELQANMISTQIPFFYEDYSYYFSKLKMQPSLNRWTDRDRKNLSLWIVKVLAYRHMLEKIEKPVLQRYIDLLRAQFFPMVLYPNNVKSFNLPTVDEFKALLYKNDIGYKPENSKLFVKRFYRIPSILFPLESVASNILLNSEYLRTAMEKSGDQVLLKELDNAGLSAEYLPELRKIISENAPRFIVQESKPIDMSMMGEMIQATNDAAAAAGFLENKDSLLPLNINDDVDYSPKVKPTEEAVEEVEEEEVENTELVKFSTHQIEVDEQRRLSETPSAHNRIMRTYPDLKPEVLAELKPFLGRDKAKMSPQEWAETVAKYYKEPVSALDKDRDNFFRSMEPVEVEQAEDEAELFAFHRVRTENEIILRARLQLQFDQKEAARRAADWKKRRIIGMNKKEPEEGLSRRKREKIPFEHRPSIKLNYPKRLR